LLVGVFPASAFAIPGFSGKETNNEGNPDFRFWMIILFWTVLILFSIVKTKIVHYSSLCYFPLTFFAAITIYRCLNEQIKLPVISKWLTLILGCLTGFMVFLIPLIDKFKTIILKKNWIMDPFTKGNLMAEPKWRGFEPLIGVVFICLIWFFIQKSKTAVKESVFGIFLSTLIFTYLSVIFITPRIEEYSQAAAIEFYKSIKDEDVYINTIGFKSYAHLYYATAGPITNIQSYDREWLLTGNIDKPAYFVFKINRKDRYLKQYPDLKLLYEKNGFVFTRREVKKY
jgi:hypothetical protein